MLQCADTWILSFGLQTTHSNNPREQPAVCWQGRQCLGLNKYSSGDVGGYRSHSSSKQSSLSAAKWTDVSVSQTIPLFWRADALNQSIQVSIPLPPIQLYWGQHGIYNTRFLNVRQFVCMGSQSNMQSLIKGNMATVDWWFSKMLDSLLKTEKKHSFSAKSS